MPDTFSTDVTIQAAPTAVWAALTVPEQMTAWMGAPEMKLSVETDWKVGTALLIRGFHHLPFENKGIVLQYDEERLLRYTHLSSASRLPDVPESYTLFTFTLTPVAGHTLLALTLENFPTETIRRHLEFYWRTAIVLIKKYVEQQAA